MPNMAVSVNAGLDNKCAVSGTVPQYKWNNMFDRKEKFVVETG